PTGSSGGGTGSGGGSGQQAGSQPTGTISPQGYAALGITPAASSQASGAGGGSSAPTTSLPPKGDEAVGLVSGLSFGHGLIIWPLLGLLLDNVTQPELKLDASSLATKLSQLVAVIAGKPGTTAKDDLTLLDEYGPVIQGSGQGAFGEYPVLVDVTGRVFAPPKVLVPA